MFKAALGLIGGAKVYIAVGLACLLAGSLSTWRVMSWKEQAGETKQAQQQVRLVVHESVIQEKLGTLYIPQFYAIQSDTQKHVAEVPVHVTPEIDRDFPVPLGFVRLWNSDASGPIPTAAAGSDADPSGVKLSEVATEHAIDAGSYKTCVTMNKEWWDWYDQHKAAAEHQ